MKENVFLAILFIPFLIGGALIGIWATESRYELLLSEQNASCQEKISVMQEALSNCNLRLEAIKERADLIISDNHHLQEAIINQSELITTYCVMKIDEIAQGCTVALNNTYSIFEAALNKSARCV